MSCSRVPVIVTAPDGTVTRYPSLAAAARALGVPVGNVGTAATMGYRVRGYQIRRENKT